MSEKEELIIYSCVAHEKKILTSYSNRKGNIDQICLGLLAHVEENTRATFEYSDHLFFYWNINKLTYMIMATKDFPKEMGSSFLESIKREFESKFPRLDLSAQNSFSLNDNFKDTLRSKMETYNTSSESNLKELGHLEQLKEGLIDMKNKVLDSSELLDERGEKLHLALKKADELSEQSSGYYRSSQKVKRKVMMQRIKFIILIILLILILAYVVAGLICGFTFQKCRNKT